MCQPRSLTLDPLSIQIVHVWTRCVRRAFLCGFDPVTGRDYEHRRDWIRQRIEWLAGIYAIDVVTFAVLSNHCHLILRSRCDVVADWSDEEIARRAMRLEGRKWFRVDGSDRKSAEAEVRRRVSDQSGLDQARARLSDISKWMQSLDQHIAAKANREDNARGAFWEQRFGSEVLTETADVLACMIYVDLNPIRAQMAATPEESDYTGAQSRLSDLRVRLATEGDRTLLELSELGDEVHQWERMGMSESGWLSPIEIDEAEDPAGADADEGGRRGSRKGVLPMSLLRYLELLDWSGRAVRSGKRGAIPAQLDSILSRLGLSAERLLTAIEIYGVEKEAYFAATERGGRLQPEPALA